MCVKQSVVMGYAVAGIKIGVGDIAIVKVCHIGMAGMANMMDKFFSLINVVNKCCPRPALMFFVKRVNVVAGRNACCGIAIIAVSAN